MERHPLAVPERVAKMHDQGVEVLGEAAGGGVVAAVLELSDQDLEAELAVLDASGIGQRGPVVGPGSGRALPLGPSPTGSAGGERRNADGPLVARSP